MQGRKKRKREGKEGENQREAFLRKLRRHHGKRQSTRNVPCKVKNKARLKALAVNTEHCAGGFCQKAERGEDNI